MGTSEDGLLAGLFAFFSPKFFLFEHIDLMNTGEYGILDNYEDLQISPTVYGTY
jgi:hypothetical protein